MRYYLAIDKGHFYKANERYKTLDLGVINEDLVKNNNLKSLVKFTTTFNNIDELRNFLISKGVLNAKNNMHELVIYYELTYPRTLDIAYKCDEEFLEVGRLSNIIFDKFKSKTFFETFLSYYENNPYLSEEIGLIRDYANDPWAGHRYFEAIRKLINRICYKKNSEGENVLNYKELYNLAMFVSKLSNKGRKQVINSNSINQDDASKNASFIPEPGSSAYDKMEEWQDNARKRETEDENQIRLF